MNNDYYSEDEIAKRLERAKNRAKKSRERSNRQKKKLAIVLTCVISTAVILFCVIRFAILPEMKLYKSYKAAEALMNSGDFDDATSAFQSLEGYKNSDDMVLESQYRKAVSYNELGEYENAINVWNTLGEYSDSKARSEQALYDWKNPSYQRGLDYESSGNYKMAITEYRTVADYKDSEERIKICEEALVETTYQRATNYISSEMYLSAIQLLETLGDYKDSSELLIEARYNYGCDRIENGFYEEAIEQLEKCQGFKDSKQLALDAKYRYVTSRGNRMVKNNTTYEYLKTLTKANYKDSQSIYDSLYKWKITVVINDDKSDSKTNKEKISRYDQICFHYKVIGGVPQKSEKVKYRVTMTGFKPSEKSMTVTVGDSGTIYFSQGSNQISGESSITFYDSSGNNIGLASISVY